MGNDGQPTNQPERQNCSKHNSSSRCQFSHFCVKPHYWAMMWELCKYAGHTLTDFPPWLRVWTWQDWDLCYKWQHVLLGMQKLCVRPVEGKCSIYAEGCFLRQAEGSAWQTNGRTPEGVALCFIVSTEESSKANE